MQSVPDRHRHELALHRILVGRSHSRVYSNLGQYQFAIQDFNEAIRLQPDFVPYYNNRGIAYFRQGKNNLGCIDAQKACALGNCKLLEWAKDRENCR